MIWGNTHGDRKKWSEGSVYYKMHSAYQQQKIFLLAWQHFHHRRINRYEYYSSSLDTGWRFMRIKGIAVKSRYLLGQDRAQNRRSCRRAVSGKLKQTVAPGQAIRRRHNVNLISYGNWNNNSPAFIVTGKRYFSCCSPRSWQVMQVSVFQSRRGTTLPISDRVANFLLPNQSQWQLISIGWPRWFAKLPEWFRDAIRSSTSLLFSLL